MKKILLLLVAVMTAWAANAAHTVYFDNASTNYGNPYCYAWNGSANNSWPGVKMEPVTGTIYSYTTDETYVSVIFNNGKNKVHPRFRVMRLSCSANSRSLKYSSSL
jgi:uncharacterized protein YxeA